MFFTLLSCAWKVLSFIVLSSHVLSFHVLSFSRSLFFMYSHFHALSCFIFYRTKELLTEGIQLKSTLECSLISVCGWWSVFMFVPMSKVYSDSYTESTLLTWAGLSSARGIRSKPDTSWAAATLFLPFSDISGRLPSVGLCLADLGSSVLICSGSADYWLLSRSLTVSLLLSIDASDVPDSSFE